MYFWLRYLLVFSAFISLYACRHRMLVSNVSETHYSVSQDAVDSSVYKNIIPYKHQLEKEMNQVIAHSEAAFMKADVESTLGNFVSDAVMFETKKILGKDSAMAAVVILNKGGLRNALPKGDITIGNIFELMPFENELVLLTLDGHHFKGMLDKIAEKGGLPEAGITMGIAGGKPTKVLVGGQPLDSTKTYGVVTSDYLANGGDNYTFFLNPAQRQSLNKKLRDVLIDYCKDQTATGKILKPYLDGRIQLSK
jgi:2',3'-cyclic-nucleotide 2'-phosphodiesterase (5'-nucleotidase family)